MPDEDKIFGGSLVLDFRNWWRHEKPICEFLQTSDSYKSTALHSPRQSTSSSHKMAYRPYHPSAADGKSKVTFLILILNSVKLVDLIGINSRINSFGRHCLCRDSREYHKTAIGLLNYHGRQLIESYLHFNFRSYTKIIPHTVEIKCKIIFELLSQP